MKVRKSESVKRVKLITQGQNMVRNGPKWSVWSEGPAKLHYNGATPPSVIVLFL